MQYDELRPITVLFADIVGSTALGEQLRPDEVKALVGECVSQMSAAAEAYGGFVQAYQGDGICVFFGVPTAHEDDPERAAFAGLAILDVAADAALDIKEAWGIGDFSVRVGINTGSAAVGLVGAASPHPVALGDVTNTAARLQAAADSGTILVGPLTAKRLAPRFRLATAQRLTLKGKRDPVETWRLVEAEAGDPSRPTGPLADRNSELERVRGVVDETSRGRGQVLVVLGAAGIGKTRLLDEVERGSHDSITWIRGGARPYAGSVSYATLMDALRSWLEVGVADPEIVVRTRLRVRAAGLAAEDRLAALEGILGLRTHAATEPRAALLAWIELLARQRPLVLVLDDLQWADRPTREVLEEALCLTERLPLLLVLCMRPDPATEGWALRMRVLAEYPHRSTELSLGPLSEPAAADLAQALLPAGEDTIRSSILREAEGNPLYLEELVRGVVEGDTARHRSWTLTALPAMGLPSALESLLIARIDRLPAQARRLVQAAAVLGKSFPVGVLEVMVDDERFHQNLEALMRAEVIRETRRFPTFECAFTHGLLQEAVLSTLPASRRRDLYAAAARAIEQELGEDTDERLELLAECYARSDDLERALEYLNRAETRARQRGSDDRASEYQRRAAKVAARLNPI